MNCSFHSTLSPLPERLSGNAFCGLAKGSIPGGVKKGFLIWVGPRFPAAPLITYCIYLAIAVVCILRQVVGLLWTRC